MFFRLSGIGSAEPLMNSAQLTFQAVQPSPGWSWSSVPVTVTGSPISVLPNSHWPPSWLTLTQPCETFSRPWEALDQAPRG